jgi:hypothetical protein
MGREYAFAVAADATGSTRPSRDSGSMNMPAAERPFAPCGKLTPLFNQVR